MGKAKVFLSVMALLLCLAAAHALLPDKAQSAMENRALSPAPAFTWAGFAGGTWTSALETYTADQLPLRDQWVSLYTLSEAMLGKRLQNGVFLGKDGWLLDRTDGWSERNVRLNAQALKELEEQTGLPVYLLAPSSSGAVYPGLLPAHAPVCDEEALLRSAASEITLIPLLDAMKAQDSSAAPLYYRTDHHWTSAGAYAGYLCLCEQLGLTPIPSGEETAYPGFYGSYFARCPLPGIAPDVYLYPFTQGIHLRTETMESDDLLDEAALIGRDKYAALMYGNPPYLELTNDQAEGDTLFVIKDSYANALLPLLARHYKRIVAVDGRYFAENVVEAARQSKGDAIVCVYGLSTLSTGRTLALLEGL